MPKAIKPFSNYCFKDESRREAYIAEQVAGCEQSQTIKAERKAQRAGAVANAEVVSVGDIFDNHFLEMVILVRTSPGPKELSASLSQYFRSIGVKRVGFVDRSLVRPENGGADPRSRIGADQRSSLGVSSRNNSL